MDLMPTMLELAQVPVPRGHQLDGVSLVPLLLEGRPLPARTLFWGYTGRFAVRHGPWKLVVNQPAADAPKGKAKTKTASAASLFNLEHDVGERTNLAAREPGRIRELHSALAAWRKDVGGP
jgi:arylsulfatase A-like enzyme